MARKKPAVRRARTRRVQRRRGPAPAQRAVIPYLAIKGAGQAIEWYKRAFGAKELERNPVPGGLLMHATLQIGDSAVMMSDIFPGAGYVDPRELARSPVTLHMNCKDVDKQWKRAVDAGAKVVMPLDDQFWGDRYGQLRDPFGHEWSLSSPSKLSKVELERKREEAVKMFSAGQHPGGTER